ncbi:membrane protein [Bacillus manliponensis]|uniref:Membrane protein n=1 Tax=Bacillus manliponensis TaxID=574376 RepID=A0A073JX34_9BACI|nr:vWA domain-containing protein [Bacillus manliponensis]KEK18816.1 membrane protein [Bacillus manliponensis]
MNKRLIATCMLLLLVCISPFSTFAKGEEERARVVSLVYDDSGSMKNNDRWKYANYALQSFIALLHEKDTFSYIPMSRPLEKMSVSLTNNERQNEIQHVQEWSDYKNTPFQSVETALQSLKGEVAKNEKREFWLIVLTDGAFNELEGQNDAEKERLMEVLRSFRADMEEKKVLLHPILITMEENLAPEEQEQMNVFKEMWKDEMKGMILPTTGEDGVISSVNAAAALIANRDPFSSVKTGITTKIVGENLEVTTPFPLTRLTLVEQSSQSTSYKIEKLPNTLQLQSSFTMQAPMQSQLFGNVMHLVPQGNSIIKPGTYVLKMNQNIVEENIEVLAEPALDYTVVTYEKKDKKRVNKEEMYEGAVAIIEAKPSNIPIDSSYFTAEVEIDNKLYKMKWDEKRKVFSYSLKIPKKQVSGKVHLNIKGFYRQTKEFHITSIPNPKLSVQSITNHYEEKVTQLQNSKPFVLQPLLDGKEMSEEEVKTLLQKATVTFNKNINYELQQKGNKLHIYPRPYYSDTFNFTDTGNIEATITLQDSRLQKVKTSMTIFIHDAPFWERYAIIFQKVLPVGVLLLIAAIAILGWIVRPRFHRKALLYYEWDQSIAKDWSYQSEPELLRNTWWKHYFGIPFRAERKTIQSITFIAKKSSKSIFIAKESQIAGMVIDSMSLTEEEVGREHKTLYPNEMVIIDRGYGKELYRYECE